MMICPSKAQKSLNVSHTWIILALRDFPVQFELSGTPRRTQEGSHGSSHYSGYSQVSTRTSTGISPGSYISLSDDSAGCLHCLPVMRRQLGQGALLSLVFPEREEKAEPARGVTPVSSGGCISVPGDVCGVDLVYMVLDKIKKWSDIFLHPLWHTTSHFIFFHSSAEILVFVPVRPQQSLFKLVPLLILEGWANLILS